MKQVMCATYEGIDAKVVTVESSLTKGLPAFRRNEKNERLSYRFLLY
jgi:hypothetical protein